VAVHPDFPADDTPPTKGPSAHYWSNRMHDNHVAERGPWEEGHQGEPEHRCWVRRPGERWRMIGTSQTEEEAYRLFLDWDDAVYVLILLMNDGDPNEHKAEGGEGAERIRRKPAGTTQARRRRGHDEHKSFVPEGHDERVAYYEQLIASGKPLFEDGECRREAA
jgi:hypothetical protein